MSVVVKRLDGSRCLLGTEVGLGPGRIVLDGDPAPQRKGAQQSLLCGTCLLYPNGRPSRQLLSTCCCSNTFEKVQQESIKTWSFYRYSLTEEYYDKPTLAPPLIVISLLWRVLVYARDKCRLRCTKQETKDKS